MEKIQNARKYCAPLILSLKTAPLSVRKFAPQPTSDLTLSLATLHTQGQTGAVKKLELGEESPRSRREKRLSSRTPRVRTNSGEREQYSPKPRTGEDSQLDRQLQEIEHITVDTKAALRAFTLAEKDAGAGLVNFRQPAYSLPSHAVHSLALTLENSLA